MNLFYRILLFLALSVALKVVVLTNAQTAEKKCSDCETATNQWFSFALNGFQQNHCVASTDTATYTNLALTLPACTTLSLPKDLIALQPEFPAGWPRTCETCVADAATTGLRWYISKTEDGWVRACYPEKLAGLLTHDPTKTKKHADCKAVRATSETLKLLKFKPFEVETCAKCTEGKKYKWCELEVDSKKTRVCIPKGDDDRYCPSGVPHDDCVGVTGAEEARQVVSLADDCSTCVQIPDAKWCLASLFGRKKNSCVLAIHADALCPGTVVDSCLDLNPNDETVSVNNPKDTEDEVEDDNMILPPEVVADVTVPPAVVATEATAVVATEATATVTPTADEKVTNAPTVATEAAARDSLFAFVACLGAYLII